MLFRSQKPLIDQSNIQVQMHRETEKGARQVRKYDNSEKKENRYDAKEKGNGTYFKRQGRNQTKQEEEEEEDEGSVMLKSVHTGSFDVKI